MSAKRLLKEARESINNKDYQTCLKLCKEILKEDKTNYMALVFFGISLQEIGPLEQTPNAFKKAIQLNPSNCLAYNGLASYYEKHGNSKEKNELLSIYDTIINLDCNEKRILECIGKITKLNDIFEIEEIVDSIERIINKECIVDGVKNSIEGLLYTFLSENSKNLSENLNSIYKRSLESLIRKPETGTMHLHTEYIELLYKRGEYENVLKEAETCYKLYEQNVNAAKWICKVFNILYVENSPVVNPYSDLVKNIVNSHFSSGTNWSVECLMARSITLYDGHDLIEARNILKQVAIKAPNFLHAWIFLSQCERSLNLIPEALKSALNADRLLKQSKCSNERQNQILNKLLLQLLACSDIQKNWLQAIELYENNVEVKNDVTSILSAARANIKLKKVDIALKLINNIENVNYKNQINLLKSEILRAQGKHREALELIEPFAENDWEASFEVALIYWNLNIYDKSLTNYLKAAKLNPSSYECFERLGLYYQKFNDLDKARRCYEKAFKLNSNSLTCAMELNKIYKQQKNWDGSIIVLQNFTNSKPNNDNLWAWMQLGLTYCEQHEYLKAISTLRIVIRLDPNNSSCWETLGDAYMARGAYTSSIKSFQKALEICPGTLYPQICIATIQQLLGHFTEAKEQFQVVLADNKLYIPALKGLAETCIGESMEYGKQQLWGLSRDSAQNAVDTLLLAIKQQNNLSCIWKLLGDSAYSVTNLSDRYCCLMVNVDLVEGRELKSSDKKYLERDELFEFAIRSYSKAIVLTENNVLIWHDLAKCLFSYAQSTNESEKSTELYNKAFSAAHHCIINKPGNWTHWNLIGVISFFKEPKNYSLAQHSFIKAVTLEKNCAIAWCNLGTMYLHLDEIKLANEAFSRSQRCNPNYPNSWIGQALIAEFLSHEDSMDLFRHSTQLGYHPQSKVGYGYWVCKTILDAPVNRVQYSIHNMHAIPVAFDGLTWYTEHNPNDACGWNMLGLVSERMGLKTTAQQAYKHSLVLSNPEVRDHVHVNYGRSLIKNDKFEDATDILKRVKAATFNSGSALALALFKAEHFEESYSSYESALHWLTDKEEFQSDVLVALASMAYLFQGPEEAKTLLFQSLQLKPPSPWGLYATLSLGLLHDDLNMAQLVLHEMNNCQNKKETLGHYATLSSYFHLLKGESKKAIREVSKLLHSHPSEASLWLSLSILLIRLHAEKSAGYTAAQCARIAMELGQTNMDVRNVLSLVSLGLLLTGNHEKALKAAQRAIHYYPNVSDCWAILLSSVKAHRTRMLKNELIEGIILHIKSLKPSSSLLSWLNNQ